MYYQEKLIFSKNLITYLNKESGRLFIQTHNFPDPDAVASAFGLKGLLDSQDIHAEIIYDGELQRDALIKMIAQLHIPIYHWKQYELIDSDRIIIVDGCKGNSNVEDLTGKEIAVIDHHKSLTTEDVELIDIRPEYGSCSTIICEYYQELGVIPSREAASAMHIGLARDTDLYTRGMTEMDLKALTFLFPYSDLDLVNLILRNNIQLSDLDFYRKVLESLMVYKGLAVCYLPEGCPQNLMGILGDFILSLQEINFAALFANNSDAVSVSFRNNRGDKDASRIMKSFTTGIGRGGGHKEMAGGIIEKQESPDPEIWFEKLKELLN
ncbi:MULTISPECIES: bifunctional oligoribonuclease/PAP phosphatase NrnA [unclassified Oceanispirochaeta]|uniref:DHH family phosphoesterase n=1 Tax=unclassified Oceanispirochaeta TaxID=2635722 RepID=UPI000E099F3A|nr:MULTISPECIES: DHH family phosphoesterase [unclassified Oceanispirochaeta]MBF9014745.1 DHH family phosphoesterase [Oceanispirochaeta sp. M2]NPD71001.1 recombinase RecJ [Oceanispirochaeta sp. M1]RDG33834.1 recombinase RecJ [Oceanispirochaeta sp. M1]